MIPDTNFYIQRTTAQLTTSKATSIFEAYWRKKEEKKRIKPLNRPKRKAAMNYNQKLRTGKLSPNYATVWVAMGQREGTVFPFCSKFHFEILLFIYLLVYVICCYVLFVFLTGCLEVKWMGLFVSDQQKDLNSCRDYWWFIILSYAHLQMNVKFFVL